MSRRCAVFSPKSDTQPRRLSIIVSRGFRNSRLSKPKFRQPQFKLPDISNHKISEFDVQTTTLLNIFHKKTKGAETRNNLILQSIISFHSTPILRTCQAAKAGVPFTKDMRQSDCIKADPPTLVKLEQRRRNFLLSLVFYRF